MTTQIRGNCQVCNRDVAVTKGTVSKHGYTVQHGYFSGTCWGAEYLPIQMGKDRREAWVENLGKMAESRQAYINQLKGGELTTVIATERDYNTRSGTRLVTYTPNDPRGRNSWHRWSGVYTWQDFLDMCARQEERTLKYILNDKAVLEESIKTWVPTPETLRMVEK